ncbi:MAG: DNA topoisomerase (ATP-hydrolyzing) subunit A [Bacillota bacterium]|nr:DNA topoisomerase (ATP-hydrolyzing) subunit A [Bacillota bacterium]
MKDRKNQAQDLYTEQQITETIVENYMPYIMSVIVSRAIPAIDGFKPSHRKILYTMYKMKLLGGQRTKSANVVGQTMKLNPHGDQAIYETLVRLAKGNETLILPYVDSKGNFGKVSSRDMMYAAPRYTEVRLEHVCEAIFRDIDKDNVDFVDNYDSTMKEPTLLPTVFPNILANPNMGIAVGMASNIASFNLRELCRATEELIKNPDADLLAFMPAPDFSTGGEIVYERSKMEEIYNTGLGSIRLRGKTEYDAQNNILLITEIPYTTTVEQIIEKVVELVKLGKIKEINDIRDETDLSGLKIALDLKRGVDVEKLRAKLFKMTSLTDSFGCNFNILIDGMPRVLGVRQILLEWLKFRRECIRRAARYDKKQLTAKLHIIRGLEKVLLDIDKAIHIVRNTEKDSEVIPRLSEAFDIDKVQAENVAEIKLRNLNKDYILSKTAEISEIEKELADLDALIAEQSLVDRKIISELAEIAKKYGYDRRTRLVAEEAAEQDVQAVEEIEDFNLKLFVTEQGYLKKVTLVSLRSSGDHKLKEDDRIVQEIEGTNRQEAIFFTNQCNAYKVKLYEIGEHKVSELGEYLTNLLQMEKDERVLYTVLTGDFSGNMLFVFRNGKIAKIPLSAYMTKQNRKKLIKAYADESQLVRMFHLREDADLTLIRQSAKDVKALTVNSAIIPEKITKNSIGVQVFRLNKGSLLAGAFLSESHTLKNAEKFKRDVIPSSGDEVDAIEAMTMSNWIDS